MMAAIDKMMSICNIVKEFIFWFCSCVYLRFGLFVYIVAPVPSVFLAL